MYDITRHYRLSHALVHLVIDRANFITNQRTSRLPIRAKHKHFSTIWEYPFDTSPTDFFSLIFLLLSRFVRQPSMSFHTLLGMTTRWNSRFKPVSVLVHNIFAHFTLYSGADQVHMIQERCWFSHRIKILDFCGQICKRTIIQSHTRTLQPKPAWRWSPITSTDDGLTTSAPWVERNPKQKSRERSNNRTRWDYPPSHPPCLFSSPSHQRGLVSGACSCQQPDEGSCLLCPPPNDLIRQHNQPNPCSTTDHFGIDPLLASTNSNECCPVVPCPRRRWPIAMQRWHQSGVHCKLGATKQRQTIHHNFEAASISGVKCCNVHVPDHHVDSNSSAFHCERPSSQLPRPRARCSMVAKRIEWTATPAAHWRME